MTPKRAELLGAAGLLLAYLPVCLFTFAVTDDWVVLDHVLNGTTKWGLSEMSHGRLLHGLAVATVELAADSLEDFQIFRLVCVLSLVVLYILMGRFFMTVKLFESLNLFTPPPMLRKPLRPQVAGTPRTRACPISSPFPSR